MIRGGMDAATPHRRFLHWASGLFFAVATLNYTYKMLAAIALIPLLYAARRGIHWYLGHAQAESLHCIAHPSPSTEVTP